MNRRRAAVGSRCQLLLVGVVLAVASCTSVPQPTIEAAASTSAGASTAPAASTPAATDADATDAADTPGPTEIESSEPLPSPGGTCAATQLVPGTATNGFTFSVVDYRHVDLEQPVRNAGGGCVLNVPAMIGVASATGPFQAVRVNNIGYPVCVNSACHYVSPPSYKIRPGQSLTIGFSVSWWTGGNDENGLPVDTPPPCPGAVSDVTRVEVPLASGAITIDLETAVRIPESSVPWQEVCAGRDSIPLTITTESP